MAKRRIILFLLALTGVVGFSLGVLKLLLLRFEAGDIYPPYSSLRADPLGTKVLYESLAELPGVRVRRNYLPLRRLTARKGATLLYLGARPTGLPLLLQIATDSSGGEGPDKDDDKKKEPDRDSSADEDPVGSLLDFVSGGGRVVISFSPKATLEGIRAATSGVEEELGFSVDSVSPEEQPMTARPGEADEGEAPSVSWHTPWYFEELSPEWREVYVCDDKPVIIERRYKAGSIVLCTDTYFLSNEAMLKERRPRLLAWLVGRREIVFDETHLGAVQEAGIATLAREYHLAGLFFVLLLLAGLFVWKNAVTFLPRSRAYVERLSGAGVAGRGSAAGLVNLLRKSISRKNILLVCLNEWIRSGGTDSPGRKDARQRAEGVVKDEQARSRKHRDPAAAYRSICRILSERK